MASRSPIFQNLHHPHSHHLVSLSLLDVPLLPIFSSLTSTHPFFSSFCGWRSSVFCKTIKHRSRHHTRSPPFFFSSTIPSVFLSSSSSSSSLSLSSVETTSHVHRRCPFASFFSSLLSDEANTKQKRGRGGSVMTNLEGKRCEKKTSGSGRSTTTTEAKKKEEEEDEACMPSWVFPVTASATTRTRPRTMTPAATRTPPWRRRLCAGNERVARSVCVRVGFHRRRDGRSSSSAAAAMWSTCREMHDCGATWEPTATVYERKKDILQPSRPSITTTTTTTKDSAKEDSLMPSDVEASLPFPSASPFSAPSHRVVTITEKKRLDGCRIAFSILCRPYLSSPESTPSTAAAVSPAPLRSTTTPTPPVTATLSSSSSSSSASVAAVGAWNNPPTAAPTSRPSTPSPISSLSFHPQATATISSERSSSPPATSPLHIEPVKRVLLWRCGHHAARLDKRYLIHSQDWRLPLLPEGLAASREMGVSLSELIGDEPVYVYYSPYIRARDAMKVVLEGLEEGKKARLEREQRKACPGSPIHPSTHTLPSSSSSSLSILSSQICGIREDARLRGGDFGRYNDVNEFFYHMEQCEKYGPFFYRFPHGESGADVCDRVTSFIGSFQRERLELKPDTNVLLITHDIVIRMFIKRWFHLNVETFHQMRSMPPSSLLTLSREHHQSSFRLNEECVEMLGLPLSLNEHNGYRFRNKNYLGSMSSGAPFM